MDLGAEVALELFAGGGADGADHLAAGADEDALLGLGLHPGLGEDDGQALALGVDLLDDDLDGVRDLLERPAQDLLAVATGTGEVLVPFVKAFAPAVDIAAGTVTLTPPAGLFEDLPDDDPELPGDQAPAEHSVD